MPESSVPASTPPPPTAGKPVPPRRHPWLRRVGWTLLGLLLVLVVFHRPIIHTALRLVLVKVAARQNIALQVHFSGSIFTNLTVADVQALPETAAPSLVEKITIERVTLRYSIPRLIRNGVGEFLESYEVINADLAITPPESEEEKAQKKTLAEDLNNLLAQPALYADRVRIENLNLVLKNPREPQKETQIQGLNLTLFPDAPGELRVQHLQIPGLPTWSTLQAATSYRQRNLIVSGLRLSEELLVKELRFDASQRVNNKGALGLKADLFGGSLDLSLAGTQLKKKGENLDRSYDTTLQVEVAGVEVQRAARYFGAQEPPVGRLALLKLQFSGEPEKPRTWVGSLQMKAEELALAAAKVESVETRGDFDHGQVKLEGLQVLTGKTQARVTATALLPESVNDFAATEADATLVLDVPDAGELARPFLPQPVRGMVRADGKISLHGRVLKSTLEVAATELGLEKISARSIQAAVQVSKQLSLPEGSSALAGLQSQVSATIAELRADTLQVDAAKLRATTVEAKVTVEELAATRGENNLNAKAALVLPPPGGKLGPVSVEFALQAPKLEQFGVAVGGRALAGKLSGTGQVDSTAGKYVGSVNLDGSSFSLGEFTARTLAARITAADDLVRVEEFALVVNEQSRITAQGTYGLRSPQAVQGEADVKLEDLSVFQPLLAGFGVKQPVGGAFVLEAKLQGEAERQQWQGNISATGTRLRYGDFVAPKLSVRVPVEHSVAKIEEFSLLLDERSQVAVQGEVGLAAPQKYEGALLAVLPDLSVLQPLLASLEIKEKLSGAVEVSLGSSGTVQGNQHSGQLQFAAAKVEYGKIQIQEARLAGLFGPTFAESSEFKVVSGVTEFTAGLEWREKRLRIKDIDLRQGDQQALAGFVLLPFEPGTAELIPMEKRVAVNVVAKELDVAKLLATVGQEAPVAGKFSVNLSASGTPRAPLLHLKVVGREIKAKAAAKFDPVELDLTAHYGARELTLEAEARQREIQPIKIKGLVPVDLNAAVEKRALDLNLPVDLTVQMADTSLAFVPKLVPSLRSIAGTVGMDLRVGGTVGAPKLGGYTAVKLEYARLQDEGVPGIGPTEVRLALRDQTIQLERVRGEIGGGGFEVTGGVNFAKLTEPIFAVRARSNSVLVKRDDSITIRVDSDVRVDGPLAAGKVEGTVWVVESRFFRDIDILPIALPGRPKPKPTPRAVQNMGAALKLPPLLEKWVFNVAVKTKADDPFRIKGNLANGEAAIDLKLGGTGHDPTVEGNVSIQRLVASLPFSNLEIRRGFITFTREALLEPRLEISAESRLREYQINAYISGTAFDPQLTLTSEPPLPQQDILALLATGTTTSELSGSSEVLASKAAVILFQELYRKVFKKKPDTANQPYADRFQVQVGTVDSQTGRQEIGASFRLLDKLYLIGDVDVSGEFTGRLRYLIRFR